MISSSLSSTSSDRSASSASTSRSASASSRSASTSRSTSMSAPSRAGSAYWPTTSLPSSSRSAPPAPARPRGAARPSFACRSSTAVAAIRAWPGLARRDGLAVLGAAVLGAAVLDAAVLDAAWRSAAAGSASGRLRPRRTRSAGYRPASSPTSVTAASARFRAGSAPVCHALRAVLSRPGQLAWLLPRCGACRASHRGHPFLRWLAGRATIHPWLTELAGDTDTSPATYRENGPYRRGHPAPRTSPRSQAPATVHRVRTELFSVNHLRRSLRVGRTTVRR